jgi:hypothetical protein
MEKLFGQLRSTLHSDLPGPQTWRRILRLIDRAPADYAAHTLVPYADKLLDATWPDALRLAPAAWLAAIHTGKTPVGWPLARALRASTLDPLPVALTRGELLATVRVIEVTGNYTASPNTLAIIQSPALRSLRCFDGLYHDVEPALLDALLTRHPSLQTLRLGKWQQRLTTPLSSANLPALHTLDLRPMLLSQPIIHDLLHTAALPALRDLTLQITGGIARDTLRGATLTHQLSSLHITQQLGANQRAIGADLLHALPSGTRLDRLTLTAGLHQPGAMDALLSSAPPGPRALTLEHVYLSDEERAQLGLWSGLEGVEALTLRNALPHAQQSLDPLLHAPWTASLRALHMHNNSSRGLARTLTTAHLPRLESLWLETCSLRDWPVNAAHNMPALTALTLKQADLAGGSIAAITAAPWLPQLTQLTVGEDLARSRDSVVALCARVATLPDLRALDIHQLPSHIRDLTALLLAPMPALRSLKLGAPAGLAPEHLQALREAAWLPQLDELELHIKRCEALTNHNLRADLLRHGLPRTAHVSY